MWMSIFFLSYKYVKIIVLKDEVIKPSQYNDLSREITRSIQDVIDLTF